MADILLYAHFVASKTGKTGLTPTIDVHQVTRSSGAHSEIVTAGNMSEVGDGAYLYLLSGADLTLYDYVAVAKTADATVDQQHLACLWTLWSLSWHDVLSAGLTVVGSIGKRLVDYVDAAISGRAAPGAQMDIVNAPNATGIAAISTANWNYGTGSGRTLSAGAIVLGTFSAALQAVIALIDAAISTRATQADVTAIKAKTDNLPASPAAVGSQMDLVPAPNATALTAIGTAVWSALTAGMAVVGSIGKALSDLLAVFNATTRTLTQSAAQVAAAVAGPNLAVTRFVTYDQTLTGLTIPATWSVMWLTAKGSKKDPDASAQFMVRVTNGGAASDGGQYYNKVVATAITRAYASLTPNQGAGTIRLLIQDNGTVLLSDAVYYYDAKCLLADGSIQQIAGRAKFTVDSSYTQALA